MQQTLYTFGYLSPKGERIISELITVRTPLVDVRFNPDSRNWRYKQETLQARQGAIYRHIVELGNELYKDALSGEYTEPHIKLHAPGEGLAKLKAILDEFGRAAVFCACSNKTRCHRIEVARLARAAWPELKIVHL